MGDFLKYGVTPKGGAAKPLVVNTDPRGKGPEEFVSIVQQEAETKRANELHWEQMAKENDFNAMGYLGRSIVNESISANLFGIAEDFIAEFDPEFDPTPLIDDSWPDWRKDEVAQANNEQHAKTLIDRTEAQDLYQKEGQYLGGVGTALQLAGAVANPENLLLGIGEVATITKLGLTGGKAILAGSAIGSLTNAGQEAVIVSNNASREEYSIALAAGFGAAFGTLSGLAVPKGMNTVDNMDKSMGKNISGSIKADLDIAAGDVKVPPSTVRRMSPEAKTWAQAVDSGAAAVDPVTGKYVVAMGENVGEYETKAQAVAAARLIRKDIEPTPVKIKEEVDLDYHAQAADAEKRYPRRKGKGPTQSAGLEGRSNPNPFTRMIHYLMTEDASGMGAKGVTQHSAALKADKYAMQMRSLFHVERQTNSKLWAREQGQKGLRKWVPWDTSDVDRFDDAVIMEVAYRNAPETKPRGYDAHPSVKAQADAYQNLKAAQYDLMKQKGVTGYDTMELSDLHISHKWDGIAMTNLTKQFDKEFVIGLLKQGILRGNEFTRMHKYGKLGAKLDDAYMDRTATNMAKAIYSRYTRRPDTVNMARAGWLTKADRAEFERRATDLIDNPADLKHLLSSMDGKDSRKVNELLSQIDMNINVKVDGISVRDLMDTNLGASIDTDIRRTAGKAAMADAGFADRDEFLELAEKAGRWNRENLSLEPRKLRTENEKNQKVWNLMMGENLETAADSGIARTARAFRRNATLVSLNQVGFAQAAETGRLAGSIGVRGMIKQIPEFRNMIRDMKTGTFKDPILNDIEAAFGIRLGDNHLLNHPSLLAESGGFGITKADSKGFMAGLETVQNKLLHAQGYMNGMNAVMKAQHRMHARGFFDRVWKDMQLDTIGSRRMKRYADMGLTPEDLAAIKLEMANNAEVGVGWFGQKRMTNLNLVRYNPEIREKLALAFHKNQSQAIQRNLGGETAWWMEGTAGKLFSQFRTFPLVAIEKQLVKDLKYADIESLTTMTASMGFAALAYTTKTYANSFGLDSRKRKQYLKNRLTPEKIFAGAASWAGQAAILPDMMQTAGDFGLDNPFVYTAQKGQAYKNAYRQTGLDLGTIGPVGSQVDAAYKFATGMSRAALTAEDFRRDTFKNLPRFIPMGNNLAMKTAANYILN